MRTLERITTAVRRNEEVSDEELRYCVAAYDVFLAKIEMAANAVMLHEFFIAAEACPKEYIGWANDFKNPDFVALHKADFSPLDRPN